MNLIKFNKMAETITSLRTHTNSYIITSTLADARH